MAKEKFKTRLVQVRLNKSDFKLLDEGSKEEGISNSEYLRRSIEFYGIFKDFEKSGRELLWEDLKTKTKTKIII
jgi:hypothetical protein